MLYAVACVVVGFAIMGFGIRLWVLERREQKRTTEIIDWALLGSGLPHPYRLPYESNGDALDRIWWWSSKFSAAKWANETSGIVSAPDYERGADEPATPYARLA